MKEDKGEKVKKAKIFKKGKTDKGLTLVELLWVTSFIFVVLMAAFFIAETGLNVSRGTTGWVQAQSEARQVERIITRYLRQAKALDASKVGDYNLGFYAEVDGDESSPEYFEVSFNNTTLILSRDGRGQVLSTVARNAADTRPMFTYYDRNGSVITDVARRAADTRSIRVTVITDSDPNSEPPPYTLTTLVKLRNFVY